MPWWTKAKASQPPELGGSAGSDAFSSIAWNPFSRQLGDAYDAGSDPLLVISEMMDSTGLGDDKSKSNIRPEAFFQIFLAVSDLLYRHDIRRELRLTLLKTRRSLAIAVSSMGDDLKEGVDLALQGHTQQLMESKAAEQLAGEIEHSLTQAVEESLRRHSDAANSDTKLATAERDQNYREIIFCCTAACKGGLSAIDEFFQDYEKHIDSIDMLKEDTGLLQRIEVMKLRQKLQVATYWDYRLSISLIPEGEGKQKSKDLVADLLRPDITASY